MRNETPITELKGIGEKTAEKFHKADIYTAYDLVSYFPRGYETYEEPATIAECADGQLLAVCGFIERTPGVHSAGRLRITTAHVVTDQGERISLVWYNMPYLRGAVKPREKKVFRGRVKVKGNTKTLLQPQMFSPEEYQEKLSKMWPIYPLTAGLTAGMLGKAIRQAFDGLTPFEDYLPESIRERYQLAEYGFALERIHYPADRHDAAMARSRLVFDEFLIFILSLHFLREERTQETLARPMHDSELPDKVTKALPYELTGAQLRVWDEIRKDLTGPVAAARLVQGDVGSGKTIIAFLAMLLAADNGRQSALMVPTEVLARQHYEGFIKLCEQTGIDCEAVLLTGSMTAAQKREAYGKISSGEAAVVIGTHALIQDKVSYKDLSLVVTDEQHRFGVRQREALSMKGDLPHTIVMSATPIPRTLAVILYGDLDVSVIDEMPASRLPIKNCVVDTGWRKKAYSFIDAEIEQGHQAYVICPMVEESEAMEAENVEDYADTLRGKLAPGTNIGVLHGKMKPAEKNEIMQSFADGIIQVLVSTTVVEVGVNVPNATVMMIENSERFGLAQLHQLRGRVGRGSAQSYCIMVHTADNEGIRKRLDILNKSNDGFEIAAKDLQLRGPGDIFGVRQSGILNFELADVFADASVMKNASAAAEQILLEDSTLERPEHAKIRAKVMNSIEKGAKNLNI